LEKEEGAFPPKMSIINYLSSLQKSMLDQLYQSPAATISLVQLQSPLAQTLIYRLLYLAEEIPYSMIECWMKKKQKKQEECL
jgi:hypothetical protein